MAQNIKIAGASYSGVPAIDVPKTYGGTARFYDVSGSQTVTANGSYDITTKATVVVQIPVYDGSVS